jgi:nitrite reductase/ring-hydroxylating ferredoxin subunit
LIKRFYNLEEIEEDILLIRAKNNVFYAVDARCSHEGNERKRF